MKADLIVALVILWACMSPGHAARRRPRSRRPVEDVQRALDRLLNRPQNLSEIDPIKQKYLEVMNSENTSDSLRHLQDLFELTGEAGLRSSKLQSVRSGLYCTVQPAWKCFQSHCEGDKEKFLEKWGSNCKVSGFGRTCCSGGDICGQRLFDVEEIRSQLKSVKSTEEKLRYIGQIYALMQLYDFKDVNRPMQQIYYSSVKPVWECFLYHFRQNVANFKAHWGDWFHHSSFYLNCCHGRQNTPCGRATFDVEERKQLQGKCTEEILRLIDVIHDKVEQRGPLIMNSALRLFMTRIANPVRNCFTNHCNGNLDEFIRRWGDPLPYYEFRFQCCPGANRKYSESCGYDAESDGHLFDLDERKQLHGMSTRDILDLADTIHSKVQQKGDQMVAPALQTILFRAVNPILFCLSHHCSGNVDEFVRKWGERVAYSRFRTDCCPGRCHTGPMTCGSHNSVFDVPERRKLKGKPTREILAVIERIKDQVDRIGKRPRSRSLHNFMGRAVYPMLSCLHRHCGGNVDEFVRRWGERCEVWQFRYKCCPRKGGSRVSACAFVERTL